MRVRVEDELAGILTRSGVRRAGHDTRVEGAGDHFLWPNGEAPLNFVVLLCAVSALCTVHCTVLCRGFVFDLAYAQNSKKNPFGKPPTSPKTVAVLGRTITIILFSCLVFVFTFVTVALDCVLSHTRRRLDGCGYCAG